MLNVIVHVDLFFYIYILKHKLNVSMSMRDTREKREKATPISNALFFNADVEIESIECESKKIEEDEPIISLA